MNGVPTVEAVFRYPVKSMLGTRVEQAEVRASGLVADRGWALVNLETGKVASAKRPRLWRSLLQLRAEYHAERRRRRCRWSGNDHAAGRYRGAGGRAGY